MCVAPTRAETEDLTEEIEVEFDELPVLVNTLAARVAENIRVHEQWSDNSFLTIALRGQRERSAGRRQAGTVAQPGRPWLPMEGKAHTLSCASGCHSESL